MAAISDYGKLEQGAIFKIIFVTEKFKENLFLKREISSLEKWLSG